MTPKLMLQLMPGENSGLVNTTLDENRQFLGALEFTEPHKTTYASPTPSQPVPYALGLR
jgi:hypothetical protein